MSQWITPINYSWLTQKWVTWCLLFFDSLHDTLLDLQPNGSGQWWGHSISNLRKQIFSAVIYNCSHNVTSEFTGKGANCLWFQSKIHFYFETKPHNTLAEHRVTTSQMLADRSAPVCVYPGCFRRSGRCQGIPESVHTPSRSPLCAAQDAEHGPGNKTV